MAADRKQAELAKDSAARAHFLSDAGPGERREALAALIDSTLLRPEATAAQIEALCSEAVRLRLRAVCVPPALVPVAARVLQGARQPQTVALCTVVGFPLGYTPTEIKVMEMAFLARAGATEIDFVQNLGLVKAGDWTSLSQEMEVLVRAVPNALTKVILETCALTTEEIVRCTRIACAAGVDVIKTSTGFGSRGASVEDIVAIVGAIPPKMVHGIKASGGIKTLAQAQALIAAGATRIGASAGAALLAEIV